MRSLKMVLAALLCLHLALPSAMADELTPEKRADIEKLLQVTDTLSLSKQMGMSVINQILKAKQAEKSEIPPEDIESLRNIISEVIDTNLGTLKEMFIPLYHRHFSATEIKSLIDFYNSEVGKKTVKVMPQLMQESMMIGQLWAASIKPDLERRIFEHLQTKYKPKSKT